MILCARFQTLVTRIYSYIELKKASSVIEVKRKKCLTFRLLNFCVSCPSPLFSTFNVGKNTA